MGWHEKESGREGKMVKVCAREREKEHTPCKHLVLFRVLGEQAVCKETKEERLSTNSQSLLHGEQAVRKKERKLHVSSSKISSPRHSVDFT